MSPSAGSDPDPGGGEPQRTANGRVPCVDVLVPTFNRADDLMRCLASLRAHDALIARVVVLDNQSSDDTSERIAEFAWDKVDYRRHPENVGQLNNLNAALDAVTARYFTLLFDDEELVGPTSLSDRVDGLDAHPDCVLAYSPALQRHEALDQPPHTVRYSDLGDGVVDGTVFLAAALRGQCPMWICTGLFRTAAVRDLRFDPTSVPYTDDRFVLDCARRGPVFHVPGPTATVTVNQGFFTSAGGGSQDQTRLSLLGLVQRHRIREQFALAHAGTDERVTFAEVRRHRRDALLGYLYAGPRTVRSTRRDLSAVVSINPVMAGDPRTYLALARRWTHQPTTPQGAATLIGVNLVARCMSLLAVAWYARRLPPGDLGRIAPGFVGMALLAVLGATVMGGSPIRRSATRRPDEYGDLVVRQVTVLSIGVLAVVAEAWSFGTEQPLLTLVVVGLMPVTALAGPSLLRCELHLDLAPVITAELVEPLMFVVGAIALSATWKTSVWGLAVACGLRPLVSMLLIRRLAPPPPIHLRAGLRSARASLGRVLSGSGSTGHAQLVIAGMRFAMVGIVTRIAGTGPAASWYLADTLTHPRFSGTRVGQLAVGLLGHRELHTAQRADQFGARCVFAAAIPGTFLLLVAEQFTEWLMGGMHREAAVLVAMGIAALVTVGPFVAAMSAVEAVRHEPATAVRSAAVQAVVTLGTAMALVPGRGARGAVYAGLVGAACATVMSTVSFRRMFGHLPHRSLRAVAMAITAAAATDAVLPWTLSVTWLVVVLVALMIFWLGASLLLQRADVDRLRHLFQRGTKADPGRFSG